MITKENFYSAYFIDNDRTTVEVLLKAPDFGEGKVKVTSYIIPYNEEHNDCKRLLKLCPLDELHENTWNKKRVEREDFVKQVKTIAQEEGLYNTIADKVDEELFVFLLDFLTSDKQEHLDKLFSWKIFLFEQDLVKNSKNQDLKSAIRKSKTPLEALKIYIQIWEENKSSTN